jgi:hypothetical protein
MRGCCDDAVAHTQRKVSRTGSVEKTASEMPVAASLKHSKNRTSLVGPNRSPQNILHIPAQRVKGITG